MMIMVVVVESHGVTPVEIRFFFFVTQFFFCFFFLRFCFLIIVFPFALFPFIFTADLLQLLQIFATTYFLV